MPTQTADVGNDFASVLTRAQQTPDGDVMGRDLPDGFPLPTNPLHRVVDTSVTDDDPRAIPGVVKYPAKVHRRVFTIWRDWNSCSRCKDAIATNKVALPDEGDYECPHVNKSDYEAICNEILAGHMLMGSEQEVAQRDGCIVISLRWYEVELSKKQRRALMKKRAIDQPEEPAL